MSPRLKETVAREHESGAAQWWHNLNALIQGGKTLDGCFLPPIPIIAIPHLGVVSQFNIAVEHLSVAVYSVVIDGVSVDVNREQIARGLVIDRHVIQLHVVVGIIDYPVVIDLGAFGDSVARVGNDVVERGDVTRVGGIGEPLDDELTAAVVKSFPFHRIIGRCGIVHLNLVGIVNDKDLIQAGTLLGYQLDDRILPHTGKCRYHVILNHSKIGIPVLVPLIG